MKQYLEKKNSRIYIKLLSEKYLNEMIAMIIAQWIKPEEDISCSKVQASLDNIAKDVMGYLKKEYPNHSIFLTSTETFIYWQDNKIDDNCWTEAEGIQIMDTLQKYMLDKFQPCEYKDRNLKYLCLDNVLTDKCGYQLILLIICESVARRLGLYCEIMKPSIYQQDICYIYWRPQYKGINFKNVRRFVISKKFSLSSYLREMKSDSKDNYEEIFLFAKKTLWK
ncbi:uncharacterized protein LOC114937607 [Nylanderia fulva]|uniref:uncharacterized protein LOC114937607 n=1 Tax=Nylanderia fulva TaxID=613905 RepID=UPI0010FB0EBC|nr:uncharacterized protein LOC114937607 [Nylanderia fulva]